MPVGESRWKPSPAAGQQACSEPAAGRLITSCACRRSTPVNHARRCAPPPRSGAQPPGSGLVVRYRTVPDLLSDSLRIDPNDQITGAAPIEARRARTAQGGRTRVNRRAIKTVSGATVCRATPTPCNTTPAPSPSSRAWRRSASARACTSGPPVSAACTTWSTRWWTTRWTRRWPGYCDTHRGHAAGRTAGCGSSTTAAASRSTSSRPRASPPSRSCSPCCTPAASSAAAATRCPAGCTASASRVVNALSKRLDVEVRREGYVWRQAFEHGVPTTAPLAEGEPTDETGTTMTFWANDDDLRDHRLRTSRRCRSRFQEMAFLNKGLTLALRDERVGARRASDGEALRRHLPLRRRPDRLRRAPELDQGAASHPTIIAFEAEDTERRSPSRSRCSGTPASPSRSTPSPTRSTPTRAAPTRRASARR